MSATTSIQASDYQPAFAARGGRFSRVVVGLAAGPESQEALEQALALLAPTGTLFLVAPYQSASTPAWGYASSAYAYAAAREDLKAEAEVLLKRAAAAAAGRGAVVCAETVDDNAAEALMRAAREHVAELVAVGSPPHGRALGIVSGATATVLLHRSPVPVLVARPRLGGRFGRLCVAVDGSLESERAYRLARHLASGLEAPLSTFVAQGGRGAIDLERIKLIEYDYRTSPKEPVEALVKRSAECDLLVLGSRGLSGIKALGSVSERVAHQASSSVLVVR